MSILQSIKGFFFPEWDERALTPAQVWGSGGIWRPVTAAGVPVSVESVMQAAQGACIRLLADDIAALPVDVYRKVGDRPRAIDPPVWVDEPGGRRWYTWPTYISEVVVSLLSDGNAFVRCFPDTVNPEVLVVLDPRTVVIERPGVYRVGGVEVLGDAEVMHIPWVTLPGDPRGINVVDAAEDSTGLEIAARKYAGAYFRNGGAVGGIISVPGGPETVDAKMLAQQFEARHTGIDKAHMPAVLTGGATYSSDTITPHEAELEPLWRQTLEAAARLYHIPPHMMASQQTGAASYASVEQKSLEYVQHAIVNVTTRLEASHSRLLRIDNAYLKLNTNSLLRGDTQARAAYYNLMLQSKVMTREEVREKEDLPWVGELGWLETPNNNSDEEPAPQQNSITISDVEVRDEAAEQLTEKVTRAVAEAAERHDADHAQMTLDAMAHNEARFASIEASIKAQDEQAAKRREADLAPGEKRIVRDEKGRITGTIERRGDTTWRQVIERDAVGNVVGIKSVAA